ncbi:MAG: single-stranded DNA-binding protein [Patescibacteria group bacterium]|nr:single-stranded DNA-binding protein [Patescibacteria group bacterium]
MYLNKIFIIGNLTKDPETRALPSGSKVTSFGVATNRMFKNRDGAKQEMTEFHNVTAFDKLGELSGQYLRKGQQVLVEGRIQTRSWESDGQKKYRTEIIAENIQFGAKPSGQSQGGSSSAGNASSAAPSKAGSTAGESGEAIEYPKEEISPDDIPF